VPSALLPPLCSGAPSSLMEGLATPMEPRHCVTPAWCVMVEKFSGLLSNRMMEPAKAERGESSRSVCMVHGRAAEDGLLALTRY
jgi:hypothetical protein